MLWHSPDAVAAPIHSHVISLAPDVWSRALHENRLLIASVIGLLVLALLVTMFAAPGAPPIAPAITPTALLH